MRVITRAVYDMTDPRFWGDCPEDALVEEESFEYEGPVALCGRGSSDSGSGPGGSQGPGDGNGSSDSGASGSEGGGRDNASSGVDSSWGGTEAVGHSIGRSEGSFNSRGQRTSAPSRYGGSWTTAYGVADHARANNMGLARASQQVAAMDAHNRFSGRRAQEKAAAKAARESAHGWANANLNPSTMAALDAHEAVEEGRLGDLSSMGAMTDAQVNAVADAYGDFGHQVGRGVERGLGLSINMAVPDDVTTPQETYSAALNEGMIGPDGSLTAKGYFSMAAAPASIAIGAVAPAAAAAFGIKAGIGTALGLGALSSAANSLGPGGTASSVVGKVSDVAGLGLPGVATNTIGTMANMADLASASHAANPGITGADPDSFSGPNNDMTAAGYFDSVAHNTVAQPPASSVNHYADYKSQYNTSRQPAGGNAGYGYGGLNMFA